MKNIKNFNDYILENNKDIFNDNILKIYLNSNIFESNKPKGDNIFTLDNGGRPFIVNLDDKISTIYKQEIRFEYDKMFIDKGKNKNSSVLLKKDNKYIFVGDKVYEFTTDDKIIDFKSPIGNSAVPYPVAIGEKNIYFMLDNVYVDKKEIGDSKDFYGTFYDNKETLTTNKMKNYKCLIKRQI
jgi:hypothetical protein